MDYCYAPPQSRIDNDTAMRLYKAGCTDREISDAFIVYEAAVVRWRQIHNLPPNPPRAKEEKRREREPYLADRKRCEKCEYQCNVSGFCFCNYLLDTGKRRVYEGSHCKSFKRRRETYE